MRHSLGLALIVLSSLFGSGCATIIHGTVQEIPVSSSPSGATVVVDGGLRFKTPTTLALSRKESHRLEVSMEGHEPKVVEIKSAISAAVAGNIIFGGLIGVVVDSGSGASSTLTPEVVHVELVLLPANPVSSPIIAEQNPKPIPPESSADNSKSSDVGASSP